MGRPTTKTDLLTAAAADYEKLNTLVSGLTEKELSTPFDFSGDEKREKHIGKIVPKCREDIRCTS